MADFLKGWEPLQRNLHGQEHWANITAVEFSKSKWQILHLGQNNAGHEHKPGEEKPVLEVKMTNRVLGCMRNSLNINWLNQIMIWQKENSNRERVSSDAGRVSNTHYLIVTSIYMTHFNGIAKDIPFMEATTYKRVTWYCSAFGNLVTWKITQLQLNVFLLNVFWHFNGIQLITTTALVRGDWNWPAVFTNGAVASLSTHKATVKIAFQ